MSSRSGDEGSGQKPIAYGLLNRIYQKLADIEHPEPGSDCLTLP